jgi:hypothetical protein
MTFWISIMFLPSFSIFSICKFPIQPRIRILKYGYLDAFIIYYCPEIRKLVFIDFNPNTQYIFLIFYSSNHFIFNRIFPGFFYSESIFMICELQLFHFMIGNHVWKINDFNQFFWFKLYSILKTLNLFLFSIWNENKTFFICRKFKFNSSFKLNYLFEKNLSNHKLFSFV